MIVQALTNLKYDEVAVIPMEHVNPSLCIVALVDTTVHEAQNKGITQLRETEHIRLEEEI